MQQLLESKRKIQIKNLLSVISSKKGLITIKDFTITKDQEHQLCSDDLSLLKNFIIPPINDNFPDDVGAVLMYIAGYASFKICQNISCISCEDILQSNDVLPVDINNNLRLLHKLDRGGLKKPSILTMEITAICYRIFVELISEKYESLFLKCQNQLGILLSLCASHLTEIYEFSTACSHSSFDIIKQISTIIGKILLNNYIKNKNDKNSKNNPRKLKKFS